MSAGRQSGSLRAEAGRGDSERSGPLLNLRLHDHQTSDDVAEPPRPLHAGSQDPSARSAAWTKSAPVRERRRLPSEAGSDPFYKLAFWALLAAFSATVISLWNFQQSHAEVAELKTQVQALHEQVSKLEGLSVAQRQEIERRLQLVEANIGTSQGPLRRVEPARR